MGASAQGLPGLNMARLRSLLILLAFTLILAGIIKFETQRREKNQEKASNKSIPEFFLEQSLTTNYTLDGQVDYQLNSDYLEYFKHNNTSNIRQAYFIFYNKDRLPWHGRSDQAVIFNDNEDMQLTGNIRVWQPDRQMEITTQSLLLSDSQSIAETTDFIRMKSPSGNFQSKGMRLDINAEKLQFFSQVSGEYYSSKDNSPIRKGGLRGK